MSTANAILKEARRLYDLGFAIHWLMPRSKRPVESGWTSGPRKSWKDLKESYQEGYNVGVRLGKASKIGAGYLAVIDVDIKSEKPHHLAGALSEIEKLVGKTPLPGVKSGRGNGSRHYYFLTVKPFKMITTAQSKDVIRVHQPSKRPSKKEREILSEKEIASGLRLSHAWEVAVYSEGRQVVLPPSIHPDSGRNYTWGATGLSGIDDLPLLHLPSIDSGVSGSSDASGTSGSSCASNASSMSGVEQEEGQRQGSDREAIGATERSGVATLQFKVEPVDLGWLEISDEIRDGIIEGKGVTDRSAFLLKASSALISAGLSQNEVLTVLTDPKTFLGACGYEHAQTRSRNRAAAWVYRYTLKKVEAERSAELVFSKASEMKPAKILTPEKEQEQTAEILEDINWRQHLDKTAQGKTKVGLKNLDLIFSNSIEEPVFVEDLFASRIEYGRDTPWGGKAGAYIKDIDMVLVKRWLADTEFGIEPSKEAVLEATSLLAHRFRIHPVRDWLDGLVWDGKKRLDTWIKDYCQGIASEPYLSEVSRKFILAMVKRVFEPGCQWDYVLVLEGKQGKYKSSAARVLAGDKWFMDNLPDLKDKDSMLNLQGKWLIELGELADVKRADYNLVKAYLVRRTDTVRPHYGRLMTDVPRQSVFIGTINEGQYLKDPTGNRRYWPVKVGLCDVKKLSAAREQLFAEAMHIYRTTNEILMLGPEANDQATEAQEERRVDDDETEMRESLIEFLHKPESEAFNFDRFKARDLCVGVNAPWGRWGDKGYHMIVAAQVLANLGFERRKLRGQRFWKITPNVVEKIGKGVGQHSKKVLPPCCPPAPLFEDENEIDFR